MIDSYEQYLAAKREIEEYERTHSPAPYPDPSRFLVREMTNLDNEKTHSPALSFDDLSLDKALNSEWWNTKPTPKEMLGHACKFCLPDDDILQKLSQARARARAVANGGVIVFGSPYNGEPLVVEQVEPDVQETAKYLKTKMALVMTFNIHPDDLQKFKDNCVPRLSLDSEFVLDTFNIFHSKTNKWEEYLNYFRRFEFFVDDNGAAELYFHFFEMKTFDLNFNSMWEFSPKIKMDYKREFEKNDNFFGVSELHRAVEVMDELILFCKERYEITATEPSRAYFKAIQTICEDDNNEGEGDGR